MESPHLYIYKAFQILIERVQLLDEMVFANETVCCIAKVSMNAL